MSGKAGPNRARHGGRSWRGGPPVRAIQAIWRDGRIIPAEPIDWPDGTALTVEPVGGPLAVGPEADIAGDDLASIARWLAAFDALPPLKMSEAEEARWRAERQEMRDYTVARMREGPTEGRP